MEKEPSGHSGNRAAGRRASLTRQMRELLREFYSQPEPEFIPGETPITVGWPRYDDKEVFGLLSSLLEGRVSQGPRVREFEESFCRYLSMEYAVAANSGSSANLLALATLLEAGKAKQGDEVIVPAATFSTVAAPILQLGLVPVFVDVEPDTYNISPAEAQKALSPRTQVLMPVHSMGNPADMPALMRIARAHGLSVVEDACESHGAMIAGQKAGSFGELSTLSFFVAHNMTTGEGGMVLTNNSEYAGILRSLREFGRRKPESRGSQRFEHTDAVLGDYDARFLFDRLGFNMRMTDLAAAMGIEQLRKLDSMNATRIEISRHFLRALRPYERWLQLPIPKPGTVHTYLGFVLAVRKEAPFTRKEITQFLEKKRIETRPFLAGCLPDQPAFRNAAVKTQGELPVSRWLRDSGFFIGCHPAMGEAEQAYVVQSLSEFLNRYT